MSFINDRNNYFSIPDILASQERLPCTFTRNVSFLGELDPSCDGPMLLQGTSLELPYWLASALIKDNIVSMELPKAYKETFRDVLKADASVVDLQKTSKYFYEYGKLVSYINPRNSEELCMCITQTFIDRYRQLCDWAQNQHSDEEIKDKLDFLEKDLMARGKIAHMELTKWLCDGVGKINTAHLVSSHKKRKLIADHFL
ncbi:hypothetical protein O3M35_011761 [Rhynocoris fuscipes]|uniref:DNA replication complex GINS protein PSF3 n=1 Tax=Rhynocoris fuscipes TaxID=488301 RepID=A0AAW1CXD8_9HEMI